jgi:hypothetical protein
MSDHWTISDPEKDHELFTACSILSDLPHLLPPKVLDCLVAENSDLTYVDFLTTQEIHINQKIQINKKMKTRDNYCNILSCGLSVFI